MTDRVLVAVEDSAAGLHTAAVAVALAAALGSRLLVVHVVTDGQVLSALGAFAHDRARVAERRRESGASLLRHVAVLARDAGVPADTLELEGDPAPRILDAARDWSAGLLVLGRAAHVGGGPHEVGPHTRYVLEFADQPVLVVPPA